MRILVCLHICDILYYVCDNSSVSLYFFIRKRGKTKTKTEEHLGASKKKKKKEEKNNHTPQKKRKKERKKKKKTPRETTQARAPGPSP